MSTPTPSEPSGTEPTADETPASPRRGRGPLLAVGVVALVAGVLLLGDVGPSDPVEIADVTVEGEALQPFHRLEGGDPSAGLVAPAIRGVDQRGRATQLIPGEGPTAVVFVAHWCPYCRQEVPDIQALAEAGRVPADIDVVMVVTDTTAQRENYPPSAWIEAEGWDAPVIMDDGAGTAAAAYGVTGFPFHVFLDSDGRVLGRIAAAMGAEGYEEILAELAGR